MAGLMDELTAIKAVEDKITSNKVANFAYTDTAYQDPATYADGVETYDPEAEQNIPVGNASTLKVNATILTKGWRAQASAITRMLMNHFLGRISYNLNKVNDLFSLLLTKLMAYIGQPNGLATIDANGKVALLNDVVNTGDSNIPVANGTSKFTSGGAYNFFGGMTNPNTWVSAVFAWILGRTWAKGSGGSSIRFDCVCEGDGFWVAGSSSNSGGVSASGLWWSENGRDWEQSNITTLRISSICYHDGLWVASSNLSTISGGGLWWSEDGKTWTQTSSTVEAFCMYVTFANNTWVASSSAGIYKSSNGKDWEMSLIGDDADYITYVNGAWWYIRNESKISVSNDLITAHDVFTFGSSEFIPVNGLAYGKGVWVVVNYSDDEVAYSEDNGDTWTTVALNIGGSRCYCIIFANDIFVVGTDKGACWSLDGKNWNRSNNVTNIFSTIACLGHTWVAGDGSASSTGLYWSYDGKTWAQDNVTSGQFNVVYGAKSTWVAGTFSDGMWYSDLSLIGGA